MPARASFNLNGLDKYLEAIVSAGQDVDRVVQNVLTTYVTPAENEMRDQLRRTSETWTGGAEKTLFVKDVQQEGNYSFIEMGADVSKDPAALYKEFGTARQAAEPFLRPTMVFFRRQMKAMLKKVVEQMGLSA